EVILLLGTTAAWAFAARAETPDAVKTVTLERPAIFEISPISGSLKETRQSGQELNWRERAGSKNRRFQVTNISVAFLRSQAAGEVKITFAGDVSSFGYRPIGEAKLNVIVRTRGGSLIYSWMAASFSTRKEASAPTPEMGVVQMSGSA